MDPVALVDELHTVETLRAVAELPTAPLHEERVARFLTMALQRQGLLVQRDRFGNLLASHRRGAGTGPLALVAHMDHPGVLVTHHRDAEVTADVLGGLRESSLQPGAALRLYDAAGEVAARVRRYLPATGEIRPAVLLEVERAVSVGAFGAPDLVWISHVER